MMSHLLASETLGGEPRHLELTHVDPEGNEVNDVQP
jgi:hypothetical protein